MSKINMPLVGEKLKSIRIEKGLTQQQVTELTELTGKGISNPTVSYIENATTNPTVDSLEALVNALGYDLRLQLVERPEEPKTITLG